jgi:alpha-galactosidase
LIKVAMIGAGSVVFSKNLTGDILSYPEFRNATFSYMDVDRDRLDVGAALCGKVAWALISSSTWCRWADSIPRSSTSKSHGNTA